MLTYLCYITCGYVVLEAMKKQFMWESRFSKQASSICCCCISRNMMRGIVESLHLYICRTRQTHFSANIITLETLPISSLRIHSSFLTMGVFMVLKTGLPVFKSILLWNLSSRSTIACLYMYMIQLGIFWPLITACHVIRALRKPYQDFVAGGILYNYHHSTKLYWKISRVCCCLYCYECAAQVTMPTATNEWCFFSGIAWYYGVRARPRLAAPWPREAVWGRVLAA